MIDFSRTFESRSFVPLTDIIGVPLTQVVGSPGLYELAGVGEAILDFYLDSMGTRYMNLDTINITSPDEVQYTAKYGWIVGGKFKEKPAYRAVVPSNRSKNEMTTAFSPGEYVPIGQKHLVRVEAGPSITPYKIYVNVMASRY